MRKWSIFSQKPWTNPSSKCRYSLTLLELHFSCLKSILSIQNIKKCFFLASFAPKKKHMKNGRYFEKNHGLTPLQNVDFFDFARVSLFRFKKHFFLSRISKNVSLWLFLLKRNIWEKGRFFDKNHGLTPLQNVDFFRLCENFTFEVQKTLFSIQNIKRMFLSCFFAQKKTYKKKVDFLTKTLD